MNPSTFHIINRKRETSTEKVRFESNEHRAPATAIDRNPIPKSPASRNVSIKRAAINSITEVPAPEESTISYQLGSFPYGDQSTIDHGPQRQRVQSPGESGKQVKGILQQPASPPRMRRPTSAGASHSRSNSKVYS